MTDDELLKHFEQYLLVTRPENQPKQRKEQQQLMTPQLTKGLEFAKSLGINIDPSLLISKRKK
jgi:hypothetical protein